MALGNARCGKTNPVLVLARQSHTTLQRLKIVSASSVTFAKLFRISRVQWHSSGELVLRNALPKGAGSWPQGRSRCPGLRRAVDLAGEQAFFKPSQRTPQKDLRGLALHSPRSSRCLRLSFQSGLHCRANFPSKIFSFMGNLFVWALCPIHMPGKTSFKDMGWCL